MTITLVEAEKTAAGLIYVFYTRKDAKTAVLAPFSLVYSNHSSRFAMQNQSDGDAKSVVLHCNPTDFANRNNAQMCAQRA